MDSSHSSAHKRVILYDVSASVLSVLVSLGHASFSEDNLSSEGPSPFAARSHRGVSPRGGWRHRGVRSTR